MSYRCIYLDEKLDFIHKIVTWQKENFTLTEPHNSQANKWWWRSLYEKTLIRPVNWSSSVPSTKLLSTFQDILVQWFESLVTNLYHCHLQHARSTSFSTYALYVAHYVVNKRTKSYSSIGEVYVAPSYSCHWSQYSKWVWISLTHSHMPVTW